jgi:ATP-binding cassette subfamily B protein
MMQAKPAAFLSKDRNIIANAVKKESRKRCIFAPIYKKEVKLVLPNVKPPGKVIESGEAFLLPERIPMLNKVSDSYKKNLPALIIGPLLKMVEAFFDLLIPLIMKAVIDLSAYKTPAAIQNPLSSSLASFLLSLPALAKDNDELNAALVGGLVILVLGIVGFLVTMVTQYIAARTASSIGAEVRSSLYKKILSLSKREREAFGPGKLLTVLNADSYQVQQGVLIFIRLIVRAPFVILGALAISFVLDRNIGFVFLAIIPLILVVIFVIMLRSSREYLGIQTSLDGLSTKTGDTLEGAKAIRSFHTEEYEDQSFADSAEGYKKASIHVGKIQALINPFTFGIISIATLAVVLFGGMPILEGSAEKELSASTIITEVAYLLQIFTTLVQLTNVVMVLTKSGVSRKRCDEVLALVPSIVEKKDALTLSVSKGEDIFSFKDVSLAYKDGGNNALSDISFSLEKGQSLGIIGPTGCGKSTLISLMERFLDATKGSLLYKGHPIQDYSLSSLHRELGLVPQKSQLLSGTIRSNLLLGNPDATDENIRKALQESDALEFVEKKENGFDSLVEEEGKNFSGGQRQRLSIARALLRNPEVLILDDATSALDLLTDRKVRDNIANSYPGLTKVIVSQRVSTIQDCDLILVLYGGKILASGKHEDLLSSSKLYWETFESQTRKEEER